ncbi:MAG: penicillin acylase family protein [Acidobacteriota bacterium]|nr:penicillin acylase family protein [Acidobacteriota bacterium]
MPTPTHADSSWDSPAKTPQARRGRRWLRIALWGGSSVLLLALIACGAGLWWLRSITVSALPQLEGDVHMSGLHAGVTVRRDAHGSPHIEAKNEHDLFFAQGYVTAQDRLWQMDAFRRNANGELAEVMGPSLLKHDIAQRVLQFKRTAQRIYERMPAADRAYLDDYARGVNAFIASHEESLPSEFKLLGYRPKPWTGVDSISVGMMMVQTLDTHWLTKLSRERIAHDLRNPRLEADLYPVGSWRDHLPVGDLINAPAPQPKQVTEDDDDDEDDRAQAHRETAEDLKELRTVLEESRCEGCTPGSNNWVISGAHTASGKPLLSNDMHLSLTVPNIWYMADLEAPGFHAEGVTLPGMPFVVAGHNEHVAWGFTALYADVQDLYVETLDGKGNYKAPDGSWKPLIRDKEVIQVRRQKPAMIEVDSTDHGPLLDPLLTDDDRHIALEWTLYDPTLDAIPLHELNTAANWQQFSVALKDWNWPTQNLVYADDQGHIAYHAIGRVPLRPGGLAGVPISDDKHEWNGYIPYEDMPNALDPASGLLATANARVTADNTAYPLTLEWADPYRVQRIFKVLQGRDHLKPQDMLALQTDVYSEVDQELAHRFAYAIDHTEGADQRLRDAADLMRRWDGRLTTDSAAASLVVETRKALWPMILKPKLGKDAGIYQWSESNFAEEEIIMRSNSDWLPKGYADWDALLTDAVKNAMREGHAPADPADWLYGNWHVVDIEHPLARFLPLVGRMAGTGPQPMRGDTTTVKQVGRSFGPSQRFTMDWSNVDGSTENIVLGESGNPLSPYFRDQWKYWYDGTTFAFPFTSGAVAAQTTHTLRLIP